MGTRRAKTITTTVEVPEDDKDLSGILKSLSPGGKWMVKIYRLLRGQQVWLCDSSKEEVSERMIAEEFGEGKYLVRPWDEENQKWAPAKTVNIGAEAEGVSRPTYAPGAAGNDVQMQLVTLQMQMQKDGADRQIAMMQQFQVSMIGIVTALIGSQKPQDLASIVSIVKEMGSGGTNVAQLRDIVGLAKELGSGNPDADPVTSLLTMVLPKVLESRQLASPAAAVPAATTSTTTKAAPEVDERLRFLNKLKEKAMAGKDVGFWADYIDENSDEPGPAWVLAIVKHPWDTIWPVLVKADPALATEPFPTWLHQLYEALNAEEDEPAAVTAGAAAEAKA